MKARTIIPLLAFLLCVTGGFRVRQYEHPHPGTALSIPTKVVLTLVMDTTRDRPVRLEQPGIFLMSVNAYRRGLAALKSELVASAKEDARIGCADNDACDWLGIQGRENTGSKPSVTVRTSDYWPEEAASDDSEALGVGTIELAIPFSSSRQRGLVAGCISQDGIPIRPTSSSTHRDYLLAANDLDALVRGPLTNRTSLVKQMTAGDARNADQVAVDIEHSDAFSFLQTILKYAAVICVLLHLVKWFTPGRVVVELIACVLLTAAASVYVLSFVPNVMGMVIAVGIGVLLSVIRRRLSKENVAYFLIACLLGDLVTGGYLGTYSGLGANPAVGARYYGVGNELSALLFAAAFIIPINKPGIIIILLGFIAVLIGYPGCGANGGDMVAVLIAVLIYTTISCGKKARLAAFGICSLVIGIILWDAFLAPDSMQSHIGRLIGSAGSDLKTILISKVMAHFRLMTTSVWGIGSLLSIWWWTKRQLQYPSPKFDLSMIVAANLFLLNDSGPMSLTLFTFVLMSGVCNPIEHESFRDCQPGGTGI